MTDIIVLDREEAQRIMALIDELLKECAPRDGHPLAEFGHGALSYTYRGRLAEILDANTYHRWPESKPPDGLRRTAMLGRMEFRPCSEEPGLQAVRPVFDPGQRAAIYWGRAE